MNLHKEKNNYFCALLLVCMLSSSTWNDGLNGIIQEDAPLEKLAEVFLFTEGPPPILMVMYFYRPTQ